MPISAPGVMVLQTKHVSDEFFQQFYEEHTELKEIVARDEDAARHDAACEATVQEHFDGEYGVRKALLKTGIMDETGKITDKRRVLNMDECPQFVDFAQNSCSLLFSPCENQQN